MYRKTPVSLPPSIRTDQGIAAWLAANPDEWEEALDLEVGYVDDRATYEGHQIDDIRVSDGHVFIQYTVEYDAYYGCKDMDSAGEDERDISGDLVDGTLIFETFVPPARQAPDDEL